MIANSQTFQATDYHIKTKKWWKIWFYIYYDGERKEPLVAVNIFCNKKLLTLIVFNPLKATSADWEQTSLNFKVIFNNIVVQEKTHNSRSH